MTKNKLTDIIFKWEPNTWWAQFNLKQKLFTLILQEASINHTIT